jgi:MoaA/NifB/PqqE/SkfB family radical SAM enzyme
MRNNINNLSVLLRGNGDFTEEQFEETMRADNEQHLMLSLGLTTGPGCNMRCIYCYTEGGHKEAGHAVKDGMTPADYEKAIRESAALGAQSVIIVGVGETLLDKNLPQIIELSHREGMYPLIFTNGTRLDKETARFLFENDTTIYLSLDSTREDVFNRITASQGLYPRVMEGIDNCLEAGFGKLSTRNGHRVTDFALNTMVMRLNADHVEEMEQFCRDRNILFTCRFPEKLGMAPEFWQAYIAADTEEEERLRAIASRYSRGGEVFRTEYGCLFWVAGVLLGVDGQARLCYSLDNKEDFGNIKKDSMKEILRKKMQVYPARQEFFCPIHAEMGHPDTVHT